MMTEDELPERTPPMVEVGPEFLGPGNIDPGFELPTGAVWQPALWLFGNLRTAMNLFDDGGEKITVEWSSSLDLFLNLRLSGTERLLLGLSPLDSNREFSTYTFEPDRSEGWDSAANADVQILFFEGELAEIFPNLDQQDRGVYDIGFAVGRQPIEFQDGMMFNDLIDSIGITRDTIFGPGLIDTRVTGLFGWGNIHRDDNRRDERALLVGLFVESDLPSSTVAIDLAYVSSDETHGGDGFYTGASATQRIGLLNTSFHVNTSLALEGESDAVSDGTLLFAQFSCTPPYGEDVLYFNTFLGIDGYASAARGPNAGGPLGRVGLLFSTVDLGGYPAALGNRADRSAGAALGYQLFFNPSRSQLVVELGGRTATGGDDLASVALGARFQKAFGRRFVGELQGFAAAHEKRDDGYGVRTELRVQF